MKNILTAGIDEAFYWSIYRRFLKEANERGLPTDSEGTARTLLQEQPLLYKFDLRLYPFLRQVIGIKPRGAFGFPLQHGCVRQIEACGGDFAPNTYRVSGDLLHLSEQQKSSFDTDDRPSYRMILDCELPIDISQRARNAAPHIEGRDLTSDSWVAAIGHLTAWTFDEANEYSVTCRILGASVFNLDPYSETFGSVVPWHFLKRLPLDPDVIRIPTVFLTLQVVTDEV